MNSYESMEETIKGWARDGQLRTALGIIGRMDGAMDDLSEHADAIKRREYHDAVQSMGEDLIHDVRDGGIDSYDELSDRLHSTVDGSAWVIYTHLNFDVLRHSDNSSAMVDEFGMDGASDDGMLFARMAFCALEADVREWLTENEDEIEGWNMDDDTTYPGAECRAEVESDHNGTVEEVGS